MHRELLEQHLRPGEMVYLSSDVTKEHEYITSVNEIDIGKLFSTNISLLVYQNTNILQNKNTVYTASDCHLITHTAIRMNRMNVEKHVSTRLARYTCIHSIPLYRCMCYMVAVACSVYSAFILQNIGFLIFC